MTARLDARCVKQKNFAARIGTDGETNSMTMAELEMRIRAVKCDAAIGHTIRMMAHMLDAFRHDAPANQECRLPESLRRALKIRVTALEEEQAADIREFDELYVRSEELLLQIADRQQRLRRFREILLARGAA